MMATPEIKPDATLAGKLDFSLKNSIDKIKSKVHNVAYVVYFIT